VCVRLFDNLDGIRDISCCIPALGDVVPSLFLPLRLSGKHRLDDDGCALLPQGEHFVIAGGDGVTTKVNRANGAFERRDSFMPFRVRWPFVRTENLKLRGAAALHAGRAVPLPFARQNIVSNRGGAV